MESFERYMRRALDLARKAEGETSPNPAVGAILVKDDRIVGQGFHRRAGLAHAEVEALQDAGSAARDATLFVTLEPCNHYGRTSPCTEAILEAGIRRVIFGSPDPNPHVDGGGGAHLRSAGLEVIGGILRKEADHLNRFFFHHVTTGQPWVIAKFASTLDGKIATASGESKWITGLEARSEGHRIRRVVDAILVGVDTVIADDPSLTVRNLERDKISDIRRQPIRVILDSKGRIPLHARILDPDLIGTTVVAGVTGYDAAVRAELERRGIEVVLTEADEGRVDLRSLTTLLGRRDIQSLLVEGGGTVHGSFLASGLVNEVHAFLSPSLLGGAGAPSAIGGAGIPILSDRLVLSDPEIRKVGGDILVRGLCKPAID